MISCRPKSPNRAEAIALALRPQPVFCSGVLLGALDVTACAFYWLILAQFPSAPLISASEEPHPYCRFAKSAIGNWVEDRTECPKAGTFYFPPKEEIDYEKMKPQSRKPDLSTNKLNDWNGGVGITIRHDSHDSCKNFVTTNDLVYSHLPKPLCGPIQRHYKDSKHQWYPQADNMECFGNLTEWGLRKFKQQEWACTDVSDYIASLYDDTYIRPRRDQYLQPCERKARNGL